MADKIISFKMVLTDLVSPVAQTIANNVNQTVGKIASGVASANQQINSTTTGLGDSGKPLDAIKTKVEAAATAVNSKLTPALKDATVSATGVTKEVSNVTPEVDKASNATKSFEKNVTNVNQSFGKVAKAAAVLTAVVKGVEVGIQGVRLISALLEGDFNKQVIAANKLGTAIAGLPGGSAIIELGKSINNIFTGEQDATEEIERQTVKTEHLNDLLRQRAAEGKDSVASAKSFVEQLNSMGDSVFRTQEEAQKRQLLEFIRQRKEILDTPGFTSPTGEMVNVVKKFKDDTDKIIGQVRERQITNSALDARKATQEWLVGQLLAQDKASEADRVSFKQDLDEKQRAASLASKELGQIQEKINNQLLANFDKEALEKKLAFFRQLDTDLSTRLLKATGSPENDRAAAVLSLQSSQVNENINLPKQLRQQGASPEQIADITQKLATLHQMETAQLKFTQAVQESNQAESHLAETLASIHAQIDSGQIDQISGAQKIKDAQTDYNTELQKTIAILEALKASATDPTQAKAIADQIDRVKTASTQARLAVSTYGSETAKIVENSLEPAISGFIQRTMTAKQAFISFLQGIAKGFADLAAKIASSLIAKQLAGALANTSFGSTPTGLAGGGLVGGFGNHDSVPAILTPGEYVIPQPIVAQLGIPFFEQLRASLSHKTSPVRLPSGIVQRLAGGGVVSGGRGGQATMPTIIADESTMGRLLAGGPNALIAAIGKNKAAIRRLLNG